MANNSLASRMHKNTICLWFEPKKVATFGLLSFIFIFIVFLFSGYGDATIPENITNPAYKLEAILKAMYAKWGHFLFVWTGIITILFFVSPHIYYSKDEYHKVRKTLKERVKLLNSFSPSREMIVKFDSNRSIYKSIIEMLERVNVYASKKREEEIEICMLLCSPALDYWNNAQSKQNKDGWGSEFRNKVKPLTAFPNVKLEVAYLSEETISGYNPLKDFISVLANHIVSSDDGKGFTEVYETLYKGAESVSKVFNFWTEEDDDVEITVNTDILHIPFQIVLINSQDFNEVVVSFASRNVLEKVSNYDVKGLFTNDTYVVNTFYEIFKAYTSKNSRVPYIPLHTQSVGEKHKELGRHTIHDYYHGLINKMSVAEGAFSPCIGNSTKFTVWFLDKFLTTGPANNEVGRKFKKILDVGSGTGVLSLATANILETVLKVEDYEVMALEENKSAFDCLKENCEENTKILPRRGALVPATFGTEGEESKPPCFRKKDGKRFAYNKNFSEFDLIIADLPFVHAKASLPEDYRFLDLGHTLHNSFFEICDKTPLLHKNGIVITAFSSLGGADDVSDFEMLIQKNNLQTIQKCEFFESDYKWIVYALVKKEAYESEKEEFWWRTLGADQHL